MKQFFFEKKNQKTFICLLCTLAGTGEANPEKVFASFFKKKRFLPSLPSWSIILMASAKLKEKNPCAGPGNEI